MYRHNHHLRRVMQVKEFIFQCQSLNDHKSIWGYHYVVDKQSFISDKTLQRGRPSFLSRFGSPINFSIRFFVTYVHTDLFQFYDSYILHKKHIKIRMAVQNSECFRDLLTFRILGKDLTLRNLLKKTIHQIRHYRKHKNF